MSTSQPSDTPADPLIDEVRAIRRACRSVATVHRMEYVLTWNVRHLANANKLEHLRIICRRVGYLPPQMVTPDTLWDYEE